MFEREARQLPALSPKDLFFLQCHDNIITVPPLFLYFIAELSPHAYIGGVVLLFLNPVTPALCALLQEDIPRQLYYICLYVVHITGAYVLK